MPFELKLNTPCKLNGVNVRSEMHGKELVPAVDLKITMDASNNTLDLFDPGLKGAFYYRAAPAEDDQETLEGIEPVTDLPNLRFPKLENSFKWQFAGSGYEFTLDFGLGGASNIVIGSCNVNNIAIQANEGGTVEISFRVQASGIEELTVGRIASLVQHNIHVTLIAPTVQDVAPFMETMESPFSNQADIDAMTDDTPKTEAELFGTPEEAFAASVAADTPVH